MAKTDEVTDVIAALVDAYPRAGIETRTVRVYCMALADIPVGELRAAALKLMGTCKFFPSIAELREAWALAKTGPRRSGLDAWADVLREVQRVGWYGTPNLEDPVAAQAVKTLGWRAICESDNQAADRAHFAKAYESIAARQLEAVQTGKAGIRPELPPARPSAVRELPPADERAAPEDIAAAVKRTLDNLSTNGQPTDKETP